MRFFCLLILCRFTMKMKCEWVDGDVVQVPLALKQGKLHAEFQSAVQA